MITSKYHLKGSPSRDTFKQKHKTLSRSLFAIDIDFCLVTKRPFPDIIAVLDYKKDKCDDVTFAEVIAYNALIRRGVPVFIVIGDADTGEFVIEKWVGGHHAKPDVRTEVVATTKDWREFERWEISLRGETNSRYEEQLM